MFFGVWIGDWFSLGPDTRVESKSKMKYLLVSRYRSATLLGTGERTMSQHDLTLALVRLNNLVGGRAN